MRPVVLHAATGRGRSAGPDAQIIENVMQRQQEKVVVTAGGKTFMLTTRLPTDADVEASRPAYERAYKRALRKGAIKSAELHAHAARTGVWDITRQAQYEAMLGALENDEDELRDLPRDQARVVARRMRRTRQEADRLRAPMKALESTTAEAVASRAQFADMLVRCTTETATGLPAFARRDERHPAWDAAATAISRLLLGIDDNFEMLDPEDRLLLAAA